MAKLTAKARAQLPNSAFAYVDSRGQRRLPIHDEAHVRNALSRFNQIKFEGDAARERARKRLLSAAKKYKIAPIGFITGQIASERLEGESRGRDAVPRDLPTGRVTFLLSDIEDSTGLLHRVGDGYGALLGDVRRLLRRAVNAPGASRSTRARTSSSASSSGRPGPSRRRSRSSAASSRGRGRAGPPSGSGSASMRADRR